MALIAIGVLASENNTVYRVEEKLDFAFLLIISATDAHVLSNLT